MFRSTATAFYHLLFLTRVPQVATQLTGTAPTTVSPQATLISMVLGFLGSGGGSFSTVTVSTPSLHTAATLSTSALSGSTNLRMNLPIRRSMRRYLASSRSSRRRSPLITSTRSSSTCTLMSPVLSPGMSTTNAYAPASSLTSAGVAVASPRRRRTGGWAGCRCRGAQSRRRGRTRIGPRSRACPCGGRGSPASGW
uniref:Secreted protein n=1 Tax=Zea mays TaxID=4577 RepID=C0PAQ6_MAIZE|nr:unknown [Zea mays]